MHSGCIDGYYNTYTDTVKRYNYTGAYVVCTYGQFGVVEYYSERPPSCPVVCGLLLDVNNFE